LGLLPFSTKPSHVNASRNPEENRVKLTRSA
jgi:hypothetical protein